MTGMTINPSLCKSFRLLNELTFKSFQDLVAVCCGVGNQQTSCRNDLIEAIALQSGLEVKRLQQAGSTLHSVVKNIGSKHLEDTQIISYLTNLGLETEKTTLLLTLCKSTQDETTSALKSFLPGVQPSQLVDMDWKFGVTAASSELDKVGATFLQLQLKVVNSSDKIEQLNMELSLSQFYNFLHELEKTKASLEFLT